jgi:hypothetical protein
MITNKVRQESIKPTGSNIVVSARWHTLTLPLTINNLQNSRFDLKHPSFTRKTHKTAVCRLLYPFQAGCSTGKESIKTGRDKVR